MTEARREHVQADACQGSTADRLRNSKARAESERLREQMFEEFACAAEGPIVNPRRRRSGRLVFGNATE